MTNFSNECINKVCQDLERYPGVDQVKYTRGYNGVRIKIYLNREVFTDPLPIEYLDFESLHLEEEEILNTDLASSIILDAVADAAVISGYCDDYKDFDKKIEVCTTKHDTRVYDSSIGGSVPLNFLNSNKQITYDPVTNSYQSEEGGPTIKYSIDAFEFNRDSVLYSMYHNPWGNTYDYDDDDDNLPF